MKFKYTNSNQEEAYFEAIPLTTELYTELLEIDTEFLHNIVEGKEVFFSDEVYKEAAATMLNSFGKGKENVTPAASSSENEILFVREKILLKEGLKNKQSSLTPKKIIRSKMITNNIRSFKKEKMELNFELAS
jgi:hypothetical protein